MTSMSWESEPPLKPTRQNKHFKWISSQPQFEVKFKCSKDELFQKHLSDTMIKAAVKSWQLSQCEGTNQLMYYCLHKKKEAISQHVNYWIGIN